MNSDDNFRDNEYNLQKLDFYGDQDKQHNRLHKQGALNSEADPVMLEISLIFEYIIEIVVGLYYFAKKQMEIQMGTLNKQKIFDDTT